MSNERAKVRTFPVSRNRFAEVSTSDFPDAKIDTIAAVATAPGAGGIAVLRLSGPTALKIAARLFRPRSRATRFALTTDLSEQELFELIGRTTYGNWHQVVVGGEAIGERSMFVEPVNLGFLDDVVVSAYRGPHSYTGEDTIEISCHGSRFLQAAVLESCLALGARLAKPGEFTERAYLNGRLDLSQAEAVGDLIAAETAAAHRLAATQLGGSMSTAMGDLRSALIEFAALIELENDFGDEDVSFADKAQLLDRVAQTRARIGELIYSFRRGRALREGVNVVIAGRPNAGKSTLLNALLGEDRAIVSPVAGTTRDTIDATIELEGVRFRITDTAGLREAADEIEALGVARTRTAVAKAGILVYVWDVVMTRPGEVEADMQALQLEGAEILGVANKMDLNPYGLREHFSSDLMPIERIVPMVAKEGMNLDFLRQRLLEIGAGAGLTDSDVIVSRARHVEALQEADAALLRVADAVQMGLSGDLVALDLRQALYHIGTVTGEVGVEDLLASIFSSFCIGK